MLLVVVVVVQMWKCCRSLDKNSTYCRNTAYCEGCWEPGKHISGCRPAEAARLYALPEAVATREVERQKALPAGERSEAGAKHTGSWVRHMNQREGVMVRCVVGTYVM